MARDLETSPLVRFQESMEMLARRGAAIDLRAYELADARRIAGELQPLVIGLVGDGTDLVVSLVEACARIPWRTALGAQGAEGVRNSYLPFERAIDATVAMSSAGSYAAVEDIAFMAQLELRQRAERLRRVTVEHGAAALLGECDSSLRRVLKALNAVDASLSRAEGVEPKLDFTSELETSLKVRRAYAKFRSRLLSGGEPSVETIRARLRGVGTQIAVLVGRNEYPEMRIRDRLLLRELQQRLLAWLRGVEPSGPEAGMRLWRDVASAVEMFMLVNRRQELREHDLGVLRKVASFIAANAALDDTRWTTLSALEGLDPELDLLLARPGVPRVDELRPLLSKLVGRLGDPFVPEWPDVEGEDA